MKKNSTITLGVIGGGMIAGVHIGNFQQIKGVKVKWVCDISDTALKEMSQRFNIPKGTGDYKDILKDPEVTAVVICTPPFLHAQMCIDSLKAGKHVMLEKPIASTRRDMNRVLKEAKKFPRLKVLECSCRHSRLQPKFKFIKNLIDSGKLGKVYFIHHNGVGQQRRPGIEYNPKASWFVDKSKSGGGPMADWGVYDLSFYMGIMGDKLTVRDISSLAVNRLDEAWRKVPVFDVEEHVAAMLEFKSGLKFYYERGTNAHCPVPLETRIYGTKGGLKFYYLSFHTPEIEYFYVANNGKGKAVCKKLKVNLKPHPGDQMALAKHFINVVKGKEKPAMPLTMAARHMDILFKILEKAGK